MSAAQKGVGAMGLYFATGSVGVLLHPLLLDEPRIYTGMSQSAFATAVHRDFDLKLEGGVTFPQYD